MPVGSHRPWEEEDWECDIDEGDERWFEWDSYEETEWAGADVEGSVALTIGGLCHAIPIQEFFRNFGPQLEIVHVRRARTHEPSNTRNAIDPCWSSGKPLRTSGEACEQ